MENTIYEKIIEERNHSRKNDPLGCELEALSKIWVIAFINNDKLPKSFHIGTVRMSKYAMEHMLLRLGIDATVTLNNCLNGASFDITLNS